MTSHSTKKPNKPGMAGKSHRASGARAVKQMLAEHDERRALRMRDMTPLGFSGVMSRVCEMVWPVWPDTASSEHGADLAGADSVVLGGGACGTTVSRHSILQRTPVEPVDQRRAASAPI